jgi:hypothetical protein
MKQPRKPKGKSPTELSLDYLRKSGYIAVVVEHWNAHAGVRQDLLGFADILAFKPGQVVLCQTTSWENFGARISKIWKSPIAWEWLKAGRVVVHGWGPKGIREEWLKSPLDAGDGKK